MKRQTSDDPNSPQKSIDGTSIKLYSYGYFTVLHIHMSVSCMFSYDTGPKVNTRTFRKQKSPTRRGTRSPSISPTRYMFLCICICIRKYVNLYTVQIYIEICTHAILLTLSKCFGKLKFLFKGTVSFEIRIVWNA